MPSPWSRVTPPLSVYWTETSLSSWSPWFSTSTVISGVPEPSETVFSAPAVSSVLPILVLSRARPWIPSVAPASPANVLRIVVSCSWSSQRLVRLAQEDALVDQRVAGALLGEHGVDPAAGPGEEHVAGQERPHVLGDPVDRLPASLAAERRRDVVGDPGEAVAAELERLLELGLGVGELVGRVEALDPLQQPLGGAAIGGDLGLELERVGVRLGVLEPVEELGRELVRLLDDRRQVRGVVLEAALLAGVEAAPDREQQEDDQEHADDQRDHAPQHQLTLALGSRAPGASAGSGF